MVLEEEGGGLYICKSREGKGSFTCKWLENIKIRGVGGVDSRKSLRSDQNEIN